MLEFQKNSNSPKRIQYKKYYVSHDSTFLKLTDVLRKQKKIIF